MRLTTAMTEVTPMTTPMSVSTLRSLCAQRLEVAIDTASVSSMVDARGIGVAAVLTSYYSFGGGCVQPSCGRADGRSRRNGRHRRFDQAWAARVRVPAAACDSDRSQTG